MVPIRVSREGKQGTVMLKRAGLILLWRMRAIIEKRFVFHNDPPVFS